MVMIYQKNEEGLFVCPQCQFVKAHQSSMHYHMKKHLAEQERHTCGTCQKTFLQKRALDLHIQSKHPDTVEEIAKFVCPFKECDFRSLTKGNCVIHCVRVHFQDEIKTIMEMDGKRMRCTVCETTFSSSSSFYYHAKACLPKNSKFKLLRPYL